MRTLQVVLIKILMFFLFMLNNNSAFSQHIDMERLLHLSYIINGKSSLQWQSNGTGIIVRYNKAFFLVSNFHVLTAKDSNTKKIFPEFKEPNLSVAVPFLSIDGTKTIVVEYPLYDSQYKENFTTFTFKDIIIDLCVMPIILPENIKGYWIEADLIESSNSYFPNQELIAYGFPNGKFIDGWKPSKLILKAEKNPESGPNIFDPYLMLDVSPEKGMSGSPVYVNSNDGNIKLLAVISNQVDYNVKHPTIKGRAVRLCYSLDLIKRSEENGIKHVNGTIIRQ